MQYTKIGGEDFIGCRAVLLIGYRTLSNCRRSLLVLMSHLLTSFFLHSQIRVLYSQRLPNSRAFRIRGPCNRKLKCDSGKLPKMELAVGEFLCGLFFTDHRMLYASNARY